MKFAALILSFPMLYAVLLAYVHVRVSGNSRRIEQSRHPLAGAKAAR
jgi:hypothetical protein